MAGGKVICSATVVLLVVTAFSSMSRALRLTPSDHVDEATGMSNLLHVQHALGKEVEEAKDGEHVGTSAIEKAASLVSREVEEKKTASHWDQAKKLDDDDDDDNDDDNSSLDHDHDHDSDSDHDHDHDSDDDSGDDDDDHDNDSDDDSGDDDDDDDDHHNSKNGSKKKHPSHRRKGSPRSKQDDDLPKVEIKV